MAKLQKKRMWFSLTLQDFLMDWGVLNIFT